MKPSTFATTTNINHQILIKMSNIKNWQFAEPGMDFRPALREVQRTLATPPPECFKGVRFTVTPLVNSWLKAHP